MSRSASVQRSAGERDSSSPFPVTSAAASQAWALARELVATAPGHCALAALLLLTAGVTEAFGLLMIIPLLQAAGLIDAGGEGVAVVEAVTGFAASVGLTLNLPGVLAVFLILAAVRSATAWGRGVVTTRLRLKFTDRIRGDLYAAVADASWGYLLGRRRSDIQHMLTDTVGRVGQAAFLLLQIAVGTTLALFQFAIAVAVSPATAAVAVVLGLVLAAVGGPMVRRSHRLGQDLTESGRVLRGHTTDFLDGLKPAKIHSAELAHVERFRRQTAEVRERQVAFAVLSGGTGAALSFAAAAALAGLVWYALAASGLALAELALLALVFARVTPAMLRLLQQTQAFANALPAQAVATAMMNELWAAAEPAGPGGAAPAPTRGIEVRDVGFFYPGAPSPALRGVSCDIPAQGIFAVTGPSGAGKTTLADLLLGLLEPSEGTIQVDGAPLHGAALRRWRRATAAVPQEPFLLHESVRSNLAWARPGATEAQMRKALELAAADFVDDLEQGLDTVVGDRGGRLSGGERQRVALAAALLRQPALLVLDEPTGQLDRDNEARVIESLRRLRGRATVVVITHGEALLREADQVLTLDACRLSEKSADAAADAAQPHQPAKPDRVSLASDEGLR